MPAAFDPADPDPAGSGPVVLVASDLDGTLCVGRRGRVEGAGDDVVVDAWPGGYCATSAAGHRAWRDLARARALVPATARSPAQFARMAWPGPPPPVAILSAGGTLVVQGVVDGAWSRAAAHRASAAGWSVDRAANLLRGACPTTSIVAVDGSHGLVHGVAAEPLPPAHVARLRALADECGWTASVAGRKAYLQVPGCGKQAALEWYCRSHRRTVCAAAGDSVLDLPMLRAAGTAHVPERGELADLDLVDGLALCRGEGTVLTGAVAIALAGSWAAAGGRTADDARPDEYQ